MRKKTDLFLAALILVATPGMLAVAAIMLGLLDPAALTKVTP